MNNNCEYGFPETDSAILNSRSEEEEYELEEALKQCPNDPRILAKKVQ